MKGKIPARRLQNNTIRILNSMESEALLRKLPRKDVQERTDTTFFRIWFNLKKIDLLNIAIGSCAAALSGISKPLFGFFIITIGVAYYEHDPTRKVGWYSGMFSLIGLLTLFSHILQHYFYTIIGETAMKNLRESLFSGKSSSFNILPFVLAVQYHIIQTYFDN